MELSDRGVKLIKQFEGFSAKPYLDQALVPTIGFGTTHYHHRPVRMNDKPITKKEATYLLRSQVDASYGKAVNHLVRVPLTQNQFDALVSFAYNLGVGALKSSTLLKKLNKGKILQADKEFKKWVYIGSNKSKGLVRRRGEEAELFLS